MQTSGMSSTTTTNNHENKIMKFQLKNVSIIALSILMSVAMAVAACGPEPAPGENGNNDTNNQTNNDTNNDTEEGFSVEITSAAITVDAGDVVTVDADIENSGDEEATETIDFTVGDFTDQEELTIGAEETESVSFDWQTTEDDAGTYTAEVAAANDSDSVSVTVDDTSAGGDVFFEVEIDENESTLEVTEGENLEFVAMVTNTGDDLGEQELVAEIDGNPLQFEDGPLMLEVAAGATEGVGLGLPTGGGEQELGEGEYTFTISSDDDEDSADVTVNAPE